MWAAGTQEAEVDRQGRLFIAPFLRTYADLDTDVMVNGALNRIEMWSPDRWRAKLARAESNLTDEPGEED